jgi:hypothetical protein
VKRAALIVVVAALSACYRVSSYDGDGELTNLGYSLKVGQHYRLDLGAVDLTAPAIHTYRLSKLPNSMFVVGIEIVEPEPIRSDDTHQDHGNYVRVELRTSDGQIAILEEGSLDTWVWSYKLRDAKAFLYRRGQSREIPLEDGATTSEPVGLKAANGWGSTFVSDNSATYVLTVEVIAARNAIERPARIVLDGSA